MTCKFCHYNSKFSIKIHDIETKCKYHKKAGETYNASQFAPKGLCWTLYYSIYADCLSLLYSGKPQKLWIRKKGIKKLICECPCKNGVKAAITVKEVFPFPINRFKEITEEVCKCIYRPFDGHFRRVKIEILDTGKACPVKYKKGQKFFFNTNKTNKLCPAGFVTCFPYFACMEKQKSKPDENISMQVHCPDYVGVTYEIRN